jgi:hypothetical protein
VAVVKGYPARILANENGVAADHRLDYADVGGGGVGDGAAMLAFELEPGHGDGAFQRLGLPLEDQNVPCVELCVGQRDGAAALAAVEASYFDMALRQRLEGGDGCAVGG